MNNPDDEPKECDCHLHHLHLEFTFGPITSGCPDDTIELVPHPLIRHFREINQQNKDNN